MEVGEMAATPRTTAPEAVTQKLMTAEELFKLPMGWGKRYELVKGELKVMSPAGFEHGDIAAELGARLRVFARSKKLGTVPAAETGYRLQKKPATVRAPDVSFVSAARVKKAGKVKGYFPGAPDLAVEVVSPEDTAEAVKAKVKDYFEAGTKLVWVIYPQTQEVVVFRSARESVVLTVKDTLDGGNAVPGFTCPVAELFA
jgi:Uma2 family endonuclease